MPRSSNQKLKPQGWMFQFGKQAEILEPESLRETMREMLNTGSEIYRGTVQPTRKAIKQPTK